MRSFRKAGIAAAVLACLLGILGLLDFLLYPCTFVRSDIHAVTTETFDDLYLGTSRGKSGIDPEAVRAVSGRTGHNLCVGGEYSRDAYYLLRLVLETGHKPQRVVYEISAGYFSTEKEEGNNDLLFFHEFPLSRAKLSYFAEAVAGTNLRSVFFPWYEYPLSYELEHLGETASKKWNGTYGAEGFRTESQEYHENGFLERFPAEGPLSLEGVRETGPEQFVPENLEWLDRVIGLCAENGIEFAAVETPLPAETLAAFAGACEASDAFFTDYFAAHGVRFLNFNAPRYSVLADHSAACFTDGDGHMNGDAARTFSALLARVLEDEDAVFDEYYEESGGSVG